MNRKIEVNYIGDGRYIGKKMAVAIGSYVLNGFWMHKKRLPGGAKVDVNVVSDKIIKKLNREYLNRNRPTDVIAFAFAEGESVPGEECPLVGQVIISLDAAKRQAAAFGHSVKDEMKLLLVHGLLHVAGWSEGKGITRCQKKILENIPALI